MADGDPILIGYRQSGVAETRLDVSGSAWAAGLHVVCPNMPSVIGSSDRHPGVWGGSQSHNGVFGTSASGNGVLGGSERGSGVYGSSQQGPGVYGVGKSAGVFATILYPFSAKAAVHAKMPGGAGGIPALLAECEIPHQQNAAVFRGMVQITDRGLRIENGPITVANGQLSVSGPIYCESVITQRSPVASEASPDGQWESFGRAEMVQGRARVELDGIPPLVQDDDYHVFLTPEGDSNGLYVSSRSASRFEVREQQGGTNDLTFSYRVVAKRPDIQTPVEVAEVATTAPREDPAPQTPEETPKASPPLSGKPTSDAAPSPPTEW